jgi:hypothetical protein
MDNCLDCGYPEDDCVCAYCETCDRLVNDCPCGIEEDE